jgi:integrase
LSVGVYPETSLALARDNAMPPRSSLLLASIHQQILALTFVRLGELRYARWEEINFDAKEWRIPAERMKMEEQHIVPLSRQAMQILRELQPLTGSDGRGISFRRTAIHRGRCQNIH